ncbi:Paf1-domain-containing protein [Aulographum hederae CBS 113979]|uniref:Paf1-domain-containing protein n=1 Tax=Aulographum hederae CBS 113979 TaxID=1176131 RepID=A0A6G1H1V3_9PEZI|nr:Paf1-domain-containing protein [Aulographum hederae CBS 113979]
MAARPERVVHQDYIARIRYSNALPPPPNPPKLLDIPQTGLTTDYTDAGYASRLAREQPLNIEADAELGMPIDLVGVPGVFAGDETVIYASEELPQLHPSDRALLRPLATLGKPSSITSGISFLRRTEYITGSASTRAEKAAAATKRPVRRRRDQDIARDDPLNIMRGIIKSFDIANPADTYTGPDGGNKIRGADVTQAEKDAWNNPQHPSGKPHIKLVESYPIVPDLEALPETGAYMMFKFKSNPTSKANDERMKVGVVRALNVSSENQVQYMQQKEEFEADPTKPEPLPIWDYELFLPAEGEDVNGIKRKFRSDEGDDDVFGDSQDEPNKRYKYERVRGYETVQQMGDASNFYVDHIAVALHKEDDDDPTGAPGLRQAKLQTAAYYYPVVQRTQIRARREKMGMSKKPEDLGYEWVDILDVEVREPNPTEIEKRENAKLKVDVAAVES